MYQGRGPQSSDLTDNIQARYTKQCPPISKSIKIKMY
jgi:hypothetical protein